MPHSLYCWNHSLLSWMHTTTTTTTTLHLTFDQESSCGCLSGYEDIGILWMECFASRELNTFVASLDLFTVQFDKHNLGYENKSVPLSMIASWDHLFGNIRFALDLELNKDGNMARWSVDISHRRIGLTRRGNGHWGNQQSCRDKPCRHHREHS